jgi:hypothetical protein
MDRSLLHYSGQKLLPLHKPELADEMAVNLAPNTRFRRGQVIGQITGSATAVQTITFTGGPTGGSATILIRDPRSGGWALVEIPYNASAAAVQGLLVQHYGANVTVTGGALPAAVTVTFSGALANIPINQFELHTNALTGSGDEGVTLATTTQGRSKSTWAPSLDASSDGSQVGRAVIAYECATDSAGWATLGPYSIEGYAGQVMKDVPAYIAGYFDTKKLVGLTATQLGNLGKLVNGVLADGEIRIGV